MGKSCIITTVSRPVQVGTRTLTLIHLSALNVLRTALNAKVPSTTAQPVLLENTSPHQTLVKPHQNVQTDSPPLRPLAASVWSASHPVSPAKLKWTTASRALTAKLWSTAFVKTALRHVSHAQAAKLPACLASKDTSCKD